MISGDTGASFQFSLHLNYKQDQEFTKQKLEFDVVVTSSFETIKGKSKERRIEINGFQSYTDLLMALIQTGALIKEDKTTVPKSSENLQKKLDAAQKELPFTSRGTLYEFGLYCETFIQKNIIEVSKSSNYHFVTIFAGLRLLKALVEKRCCSKRILVAMRDCFIQGTDHKNDQDYVDMLDEFEQIEPLEYDDSLIPKKKEEPKIEEKVIVPPIPQKQKPTKPETPQLSKDSSEEEDAGKVNQKPSTKKLSIKEEPQPSKKKDKQFERSEDDDGSSKLSDEVEAPKKTTEKAKDPRPSQPSEQPARPLASNPLTQSTSTQPKTVLKPFVSQPPRPQVVKKDSQSSSQLESSEEEIQKPPVKKQPEQPAKPVLQSKVTGKQDSDESSKLSDSSKLSESDKDPVSEDEKVAKPSIQIPVAKETTSEDKTPKLQVEVAKKTAKPRKGSSKSSVMSSDDSITKDDHQNQSKKNSQIDPAPKKTEEAVSPGPRSKPKEKAAETMEDDDHMPAEDKPSELVPSKNKTRVLDSSLKSSQPALTKNGEPDEPASLTGYLHLPKTIHIIKEDAAAASVLIIHKASEYGASVFDIINEIFKMSPKQNKKKDKHNQAPLESPEALNFIKEVIDNLKKLLAGLDYLEDILLEPNGLLEDCRGKQRTFHTDALQHIVENLPAIYSASARPRLEFEFSQAVIEHMVTKLEKQTSLSHFCTQNACFDFFLPFIWGGGSFEVFKNLLKTRSTKLDSALLKDFCKKISTDHDKFYSETSNFEYFIRSVTNLNTLNLDLDENVLQTAIKKLCDAQITSQEKQMALILSFLESKNSKLDKLKESFRSKIQEMLQKEDLMKTFFSTITAIKKKTDLTKPKTELLKSNLQIFYQESEQIFVNICEEGENSDFVKVSHGLLQNSSCAEIHYSVEQILETNVFDKLNSNLLKIETAKKMVSCRGKCEAALRVLFIDMKKSPEDIPGILDRIEEILTEEEACFSILKNLSKSELKALISPNEFNKLSKVDDSKLLQDLGEINDFRSSFPQICKFAMLSSIAPLRTAVMKEVGSRGSSNSSDSVNEAVKAYFKKLAGHLKKAKVSINAADFEVLKDYVSASSNDDFELLCRELADTQDKVNSEEVSNFVKIFYACLHKDEVKPVYSTLQTEFSKNFGTKAGQAVDLGKLPDPKTEVFMNSVKEESLYKIAQLFYNRTHQLKALTECMKLLKDSKGKEHQFYDNLIRNAIEDLYMIKNAREDIISSVECLRSLMAVLSSAKDKTIFDLLLPNDQGLQFEILDKIETLRSNLDALNRLVDSSNNITGSTLQAADEMLSGGFKVIFNMDWANNQDNCQCTIEFLKDAKEKKTLEEVRKFLITHKELIKTKNFQQKNLKGNSDDLEQINAELTDIQNNLDNIRKSGDILEWSFIKNWNLGKVSGKEKNFEIRVESERREEMDEGQQNFKIDIDLLIKVKTKLSELFKSLEAEKMEIVKNRQNPWILSLHGVQKETLAQYVKDPNSRSADAVSNIIRFIFGNENKVAQAFTSVKVEDKSGMSTTTILNKVKIDDASPYGQMDQGGKKIHKRLKFGAFEKNKFLTLFRYMVSQNLAIGNQRPSQFLFMNKHTSKQEVENFLYAAATARNIHYMIMDLHLALSHIKDEFLSICKDLTSKISDINPNIMVFMKRDSDTKIYEEIYKYSDLFEQVRWEELNIQDLQADKHLEAIEKIVIDMKATIVSSRLAGLGKTHYIREISKKDAREEPVQLFMSGEASFYSLKKRLRIIEKQVTKAGKEKKKINLLIKVDMMEDMLNNLEIVDQQLFMIIFLKCIRYDKGFLFFDGVARFYLEISNNYENSLIEMFHLISCIKSCSKKDPSLHCQIENIPLMKLDDGTARPDDFYFEDEIEYMIDSIATAGTMTLPGTDENRSIGARSVKPRDQWLEEDRFIRTNPSQLVGPIRNIPPDKKLARFKMLRNLFTYPESPTLQARNLKDATMSQFIAFVRVLFNQFQSLDMNDSMSLAIISEVPEEQQKIKAARRTFANYILNLSPIYVWSKVKSIRDEASSAKNLKQKIGQNRGEDAKSHIDEYQHKVDSIPKWEEDNRLNIFFSNDAVKLIYKDKSMIPKEIIEVIKSQTKAEPEDVKQYDDKDQKKDYNYNLKVARYFMEQLVEALNIQPTDDFKAFFKDHYNNGNDVVFGREDKAVSLKLLEFAKKFNSGYVVNLDNYLKMMIICQRSILKLPIIIMGPTGCGKTYLVQFLVTFLLRETFTNFTLHSGIREEELEEVLITAINKAKELLTIYEADRNTGFLYKPKKVWIFFDEFNTSPLQSLIEELICSRTCNFSEKIRETIGNSKKMPENLVFVAACNPFRIKSGSKDVGLVHESAATAFSHRVYPIPETLLNYTWNFGQLDGQQEVEYIENMLTSSAKLEHFYQQEGIKNDIIDPDAPSLTAEQQQAARRENEAQKAIKVKKINPLVTCIVAAQNFLREKESDSAVSLRDVERVIVIFAYLYELLQSHGDTAYDDALICTIFLNYFARIGSHAPRKVLDDTLTVRVQEMFSPTTKQKIKDKMVFLRVFEEVSKKIMKDFEILKCIPSDIAVNRSLRENLFALVCAILTKTPVMICGKPGTSKTLSTTIVKDFLVSKKKAETIYFKNASDVHFITFSGSVVTTSDQVLKLFETAEKIVQNFKEKANEEMRGGQILQGRQKETIVTILFDEMGLAEIGHDNPLKVLHPKLEPKIRTFAFIGISNWKLDLSKMNRVLFIARPDLQKEDLIETCKSLREKDFIPKDRIEALSKAYFAFIQQESGKRVTYAEEEGDGLEAAVIPKYKDLFKEKHKHPNFFGSRDFYHIVKFLQRHLGDKGEFLDVCSKFKTKLTKKEDQADLLIYLAIQRNMSGKESQSIDDEKVYPSYQLFINIYNKILRKTEADFNYTPINLMSVISMNLVDPGSRHLMLLTENPSVTDMLKNELKNYFISNLGYLPHTIMYLNRINNDKDIQVSIQSLPIWIQNGYVLILKDVDEIYNCLYDVLNQRYTKRKLDNNTEELVCEFNNGDDKQKATTVVIHPKFRVIVLCNREDDLRKLNERRQQPPFLNRFEKHLVLFKDLESVEQTDVKQALVTKYKLHRAKDSPFKSNTLIHSFSDEILSSVVLYNKPSILTLVQDSVVAYFSQAFEAATSPKGTAQGRNRGEDKRKLMSEAEKSLIQLYSRNMLLYARLEISDFRYTEDLVRQFQLSHQYDSLKELIEKMKSRQASIGMTKILLFTFSQLMEIKEIIANDRDLKLNSFLMDMEHFDTIESHQMADVIEDLVKRNKYFFILFDSKKAWSKMEMLRSIVDNIKVENHMIIFLAMYGYKDIRENSEEDTGHGKLSEALMETEIFKNQTSITFLSTEWKMQVIDDLQNSNYKWFYKVLSTPLSEMMVSQELMFNQRMDQAPTDLLHQIVERELLTKFDREKVDWKEQYILSQTDLLNEIKQEVTKIYREDHRQTVTQTIIDIIKKDNSKGDHSFRKLLGEHLDCIVVLKRVIEDAFTPYVVDLLKKIGDSCKIDSMDDAIFLSRYEKEKIFRKWGANMEEMVKAAANKKVKFQPAVKNLFDFSDVANNIIDFKKLPEDKIADLIKSIKTETEKLQRITVGPQGDKEMKSIMKNMKDSILEVLNDLEDTLTEDKFTFENSWGQPEYMLIGIAVLRNYTNSKVDPVNQNVVHCLTRMVTYYMESTFRHGELSKPEQLNNICLLLIIFYAIFKDQFDFLKLQKNEQVPEERLDKMMRDFQKTFIIQIDTLLGSNIISLKQPISDKESVKSRIIDLNNLINFMDNNKLRAENLESKDTHPINQNFLRVLLKMLEIKFANPTQGAFSSAKELFNTAAENTNSTLEYTLWLLENINLNKDQEYEISRESLSMIDRTLKEEDISKIVIRHLNILREQKRTRAIREVADRLVQFVSVNEKGEFFTGIAADVIAYVQSRVPKDLVKQLRLSMIEPVAKKLYELGLKERTVSISVEEAFSKRNEIFMRTDTDLTRYLEVTGAAQYYLEKATIICSRDAIDISREDAKFLQEVGDQLVNGLEQNKGLAIHDATFLLTKENISNLSNFVPSLQTVTQDPEKKSVSTITDFLLPVKDGADLKEQNEKKVKIRSQKINPTDLKIDNFDLVVQLASVCILDKKQPSAFLKDKSLPQDLMLLDNVLHATEDKKDAKDELKLSRETRMILCSFAAMTIKQKDTPVLSPNHAAFKEVFTEERLKSIKGIKHFDELRVVGLALETFRSISGREEKKIKDSLSKFESGVNSKKVWEDYPGITSSLFNNIARILSNKLKNFGGSVDTDISKLDQEIEDLKMTTKKTHLNSLKLLLSSTQNSYLKDKDIKKEIANLVITQQLPLKILEDPQVAEYSALSANRQAMHSTLDLLIRDLSKTIEAKDASRDDKTKFAYGKVLTALYNRRTFIARAARVILSIKDLQDTFKECINKKFAYAQLAPDAKPGPLTIGDLIGNHETLDGPITQSEFYNSNVRASYVEFVKVWKECYLPLVKEYPKELGDPRIDCKRVYEAILTEQKASKTTYSSSEIFNFLESLAYPSCPLSRLIIADDRMNKDSKNAIKMSPNFNVMRAIVIELLDEMDCISFAIWEAQQIAHGIDPNSAQFRENQNNVMPFLSMQSCDLKPLSKDTIEDLIEKHVVTEGEYDDSTPTLQDVDKLAKFFTDSQNSLKRIYLNSKDYNLYFQDSELRDLIQMVLNKTGGKETRSIKERVRLLKSFTHNGINREGLDLNKINDLEQDIRSILENNFEENWLNFMEDSIDTKTSRRLLGKKTLHILKDVKIKNLALFLVRIYSLKLELKCENAKLNIQIVSDETARKVNALSDRLKEKTPNHLETLLDTLLLEAEYWKAEFCILAIDSKGGSTKFENTILMNPDKEKDEETLRLREEIFELILKEAEDTERNFKKKTVKSLKEYVGMLHSFSQDSKRILKDKAK